MAGPGGRLGPFDHLIPSKGSRHTYHRTHCSLSNLNVETKFILCYVQEKLFKSSFSFVTKQVKIARVIYPGFLVPLVVGVERLLKH